MIGFTIAGRPVNLLDWRFDAETNGGDRTLTGKLPRDVTWAEQDAPVVAWRGSDDPAWSGQIVADPRLSDGLWSVRAHGLTDVHLTPRTTRMFYRIDGADEFTSSEGDPYGFTANLEANIDAEATSNRIRFTGTPDEALGTNGKDGVAAWIEGSLISRLVFTFNKSGAGNANLDIRTMSFTGPSGTLSAISDLVTTTATGTVHTVNFSTPEDGVEIKLYVNTGFTPTARNKMWLTGIKLYGRTTDDDFSLSDVVEDVGTNAGLDTSRVQVNATKALPLDWLEGHPELLDYLAELADWRWIVDHHGLEFGPYETTWTAFEDDTDGFDVVNERRHNQVQVPWRTVSGAFRTSTATATDDPFPGREVTLRMDELEDPQPDDTLAAAVAQARADHEATVRITASLTLHRIRGTGPRSPYAVRAGDLLLLPELHPLPAQRIEAVTYEPDDRVTVELGDPFNLAREMAEARKLRRPKRLRKKKRGKR